MNDVHAQKVKAAFVHSAKADCVKVVVERLKVALCVWEEASVVKFLDDLSLNAKALLGQVHKVFQALEELLLVLCQVSDLRKVDCDDADASSKLVASKKPSAALSKLALVKAKAAAH